MRPQNVVELLKNNRLKNTSRQLLLHFKVKLNVANDGNNHQRANAVIQLQQAQTICWNQELGLSAVYSEQLQSSFLLFAFKFSSKQIFITPGVCLKLARVCLTYFSTLLLGSEFPVIT